MKMISAKEHRVTNRMKGAWTEKPLIWDQKYCCSIDIWFPPGIIRSGYALKVPNRVFLSVIPTQNFGQSRNPEGYFCHRTSRAYFQSRISPQFRFKIPNPEPQIREIPHPEKLIGDPLLYLICNAHSWRVVQLIKALIEFIETEILHNW